MNHLQYGLQHNRIRIDVPLDLLRSVEGEPGFKESLAWLDGDEKLLVGHSLERNPHFVVNTSQYRNAEWGAEAAAEMTIRVIDTIERLAVSVGREDPEITANLDTTSTGGGEVVLHPKTEIVIPREVPPPDLSRRATKSMIKAVQTMGYKDLHDSANEVVHATVNPDLGLHLTVHDREGRFVKGDPVNPDTGAAVLTDSRIRSHQEQTAVFAGVVAILGEREPGGE